MRIRALALRIVRQFIRDRRTIALLFLAPLLVLTLMYFVFNGQSVKPDLATIGIPAEWHSKLEQAGAKIEPYSSLPEAEADLRKGKLSAILSTEGNRFSVRLEGSDPSESKSALLLIQQTLQSDIERDLTSSAWSAKLDISYEHGEGRLTSFDSFGPVLVGFFSFFFVFLLAGVAFLREKTTGTLERLMASPIRRFEVVFGYLAGFGVFTILQATLIAWFSIQALGLYMDGSFWLVLLTNLLLSLVALTLGTLLSTFAGSEFQIIQFIPLVIVPQVFFSGLFNLDAMNPWLQKLSYAMPLYYGADALRGIMLRGEDLPDIQIDIYALLAFSIAFIVLNMAALRKQRAF
ncbi:ABC transporter permease [Cohnella thailandensis]|uniref:ABC transporter permease n=1 Tax=Cohnella thailandensis TaxID=557557 RepID=A0A841T3G3_9BACL|nr:ABC transporter permease [Cohnella thailandensis]MBB6636898.1 ABC transporter permease [Cohnella thailandensis]MBP1973223.1 ABC-2 type transport system permease protein [Cohnella thailandensis]